MNIFHNIRDFVMEDVNYSMIQTAMRQIVLKPHRSRTIGRMMPLLENVHTRVKNQMGIGWTYHSWLGLDYYVKNQEYHMYKAAET